MSDWPLPPYLEPRGPLADDETVVRAFLGSDPPPHSERFHVEGPVLMADRDVPTALRIGERTVLLRLDLPDDLATARQTVTEVLGAEGMTLQDEDTKLGIAVGVQLVGLRFSTWDLWGRDIDEAFADLRTAAVGGQDDVIMGGGPPTGPEL